MTGNHWMFKVGRSYKRKRDIHDRIGGNRQSGIANCSSAPYVLLFSNKSGSSYGYEDGWRAEDEVFIYTGEGQQDDMKWERGNKAIRDHAKNGKSLLLFEGADTKGEVIFLGEFINSGFIETELPDVEGSIRKAFQFILSPSLIAAEDVVELKAEAESLSLDELRHRAISRSQSSAKASIRTATTTVRMRSAYVKEYVLRRADGRCEYSQEPAPFLKRDGTPYLEVHHVEMLAEGGNDDIRYCVAISPQVHREIHYGQNGEAINNELKVYLKKIEQH